VVNRKHTRNNNKMTRKKKNNKTKSIKRHIKHEFQDHDVDATMKTMVGEPYVHHVPMMTGGIGYDSV
jgi:hypothetical protein